MVVVSNFQNHRHPSAEAYIWQTLWSNVKKECNIIDCPTKLKTWCVVSETKLAAAAIIANWNL